MLPDLRRDRRERAISAVSGVLAAWLAAALVPMPEQAPPKPPAFRVTLTATPRPVASVVPPAPAFAVQSADAEPLQPSPVAALAALPATHRVPPHAQGADVPPPPDNEDPLPADSDAPKPPPDVKPNGNTLILAAKVDHNGTVLDLKILVPSNNQLTDLSYGLALQSRPVKVTPPVPEGQTRWIQVRADFVTNDSVLP